MSQQTEQVVAPGQKVPPLMEIARLEEVRQAELTAECALLSQPIAGGTMSFGGAGSWVNQATALGLFGPVDPSMVDKLINFYASRGIEPKVELCPFADQSLVTALSKKGFRILEFENVMARTQKSDEDLTALHPYPWPEGLEIVEVDRNDADQVEKFIDVSSSGFRAPGAPVSETLRQTSMRYVSRPRSLSYLAMIGGKAVGAAGLDVGRNVACLLGTSVLPEWRRRGLQTALMLHRLEESRRRGIRLACIHSRPGIPTERNAARIGFAMAYTKAIVVRPAKGLTPSP